MAPMTTERAIENAAASMRMEGFTVGEEQKDLMRRILNGELTMEEALAGIRQKYQAEAQ